MTRTLAVVNRSGALLRGWREARGMSIRELASAATVHPSSLYRAEADGVRSMELAARVGVVLEWTETEWAALTAAVLADGDLR